MEIYNCTEEEKYKTYYEKVGVQSFEGFCLHVYFHWLEVLESHWFDNYNNEEDTGEAIGQVIQKTCIFTKNDKKGFYENLQNYLRSEEVLRDELKAKYYVGLENYKEGIVWYLRVLSSNYNYKIANNLGILYFKTYQKTEAIGCLEEAYEYSRDIEVLYNLSKVFRHYKMYEKALSLMFQHINAGEADDLYIECGEIYLETKDYESALTAFYKANEVNFSENTLTLIVETMLKSGQCEIALKEVERLKEYNYEKYLLFKSRILLSLEAFNEAIELLEKGSEVCHNRDVFHLQLAKVYKADGAMFLAIKHMNAISDKSDDQVIYEMACIAKKAGNIKEYHHKVNQLMTGWKREIRQKYKRNC